MGRTSIKTIEAVSTPTFINLPADSAIALPIKSTRGPIDKVCTILSLDDLVRIYGGEDPADTTKSFAKAKYLVKRGETLQVIKMATGGTQASCNLILRAADPEAEPPVTATSITLKAAGPGVAYNGFKVKARLYANNVFSLEITDANDVVLETYPRLSLEEDSIYYAYNLLAKSDVIILDSNVGAAFTASSDPVASAFAGGVDSTSAIDYSLLKTREIPFCALITEDISSSTTVTGGTSLQDLLQARKDFVILVSAASDSIQGITFGDGELDTYLVRLSPLVTIPGLSTKDASLAVAQVITTLHRDGLLYKSPGGLEYGILRDVLKVEERLTEEKIGELQEGGVNPIVVKQGYGITLWGNYTSTSDVSQISDLATRLLANYLKRTCYRLSQQFIFREHNEFTWNQWKGTIEPVVRDIANVGGLFGYEVVCDRTIMTDEDIANGIMRGQIIIYPVGHIQQIVVKLFIDQSGVSLE